MKNRLPEKLTLLRKYYGYSQSDISEKLNIPVTEYMNWENGNSICNIQQLKKLADLFKVPLDAMADNTKTIVLTKKKEAVDNIDIPFMSGKTSLMDELDPADNMLPVDGVLPAREDSYTKKVPLVNEPEKLDETRVVDTQQFQTTLSNEIVDDIPTGAIEETTYEEPKDPEKKKNSIAVMLVAAIAVVAIAAIILLLSDHKQDINTLSDINRLAQGEGFTLYINQNGELETRGTFGSSGFNDLVQVSAFGTHAAGLKKNGTVVSNQKEGVSEWKDVTMIAAGTTHTVGLKKDGTVVCAGSDTACKVDEWTDIKSVYAGDGLTVAIDQNNALHACGKGEELLQNLKSVKEVSISQSGLIALMTDGAVSYYALDGGENIDLSSWKSIERVVAGDGVNIALMKNGMLNVISDDSNLKKTILSWTDIRFVDVNGKQVAIVDKNWDMHLSDEGATDPESSEPTEKLATVGGVSFSETTANIVIKWNPVVNADYYEVNIDTDPITVLANIGSTSTSIPASALKSGQEYIVNIIAYPNDENEYLPSDPAMIRYSYTAKTIPLGPVRNITAEADKFSWTISWDKVDHADYYLISVDGAEEIKVSSAEYVIDTEQVQYYNGSQHNISVRAGSDDAKYTESDASRTSLTYEMPIMEYNVTLSFVAEFGSVGEPKYLTLEEGTYLKSTYVPDGYELVNPAEDEFMVESDMEMEILVMPEAPAPVETEEPAEGGEGE